MSILLLAIVQSAGEQQLHRLEARLQAAHTIRVEVNGGGHTVRIWFAAPDRLTRIVEDHDGTEELRVDAGRAVNLNENGRVEAVRPEEVPDMRAVVPGLWWSRRPAPQDAQLRETDGRSVITYRVMGGPTWGERIELLLNPATGLPLRRSVTRFSSQMEETSVEWYPVFEVDVELPEGSVGIPADFGLAPLVEAHEWAPQFPAVSFDLENVSLTRACADLMEATGWTFAIPPEACEARVSLRCEGMPAVAALAALELQMDAFEVHGRTDGREGWPFRDIRWEEADIAWVRRGSGRARPVVAAGPFLVRLERARMVRRIAGDMGDHGAVLLQLLSVAVGGAGSENRWFRDVRAVFDGGAEVAGQFDENPVPTPYPVDTMGALLAEWNASRYDLPLALPARAVRRLDRIEGVLVSIVPAVAISERVALSDEPCLIERDGVRVEISPVRVTGRRVEARIEVEAAERMEGRGKFPGWARVWTDRGGGVWRDQDSSEDGAGNRRWMNGRWMLPEGSAFEALEIEVNVGRRRMEFPFEVTDVGVAFE